METFHSTLVLERGRRADKEDAMLKQNDFIPWGRYKRERGPEGSPEIESGTGAPWEV